MKVSSLASLLILQADLDVGLYVGIFLMGFLNFFILYWAYNHREGTFTPELIKEDAVRKALDTASRVFHESDMPSALLLRNHLQALLKYFEPFRYLSNTVIAETEGLLTNVFTSFSAVVEQLDRTPNRLRNQITELADLLPQLVEQTLQADTLRQQIVDMGFAHDAELQERDNATTLLQWHLARADIDREQAAKASQLFSEDQDERERVMTQMQRLLEIHERSRAEQERSDREPAEGDGVNRDFIGKPAQNPSGGESEPASTNDLAPVENDAVQDGEVDSISGEPANGEEANIKTSKKRHRRKRKAPTSKVHLPAQDNA